jgi:membrane protein DedA with SNARE-associated domain
MLDFLDQYGYFAVLVGTFFEGETVILLASSLASTGLFGIPQTIFFGFFGSFISDWVYFFIGRLNGKYFIDSRPRLKALVEPVRLFFHRNQLQILFSYRFLYGFRILIPLVIGMSGFNPLKFLLYSILSGLIWASTVGFVGYNLGTLFNITADSFQQHALYLVVGFAAMGLIIGYTIKRVALARMAGDGDPLP